MTVSRLVRYIFRICSIESHRGNAGPSSLGRPGFAGNDAIARHGRSAATSVDRRVPRPSPNCTRFLVRRPGRSPRRTSSSRGAPKSCGPRKGTLSDAIAAVLEGYEKSITAIVEDVKKGGYKSKSPSFDKIVSLRLSQDKRFKRVSRGVYTLAG